MEYFGNRYAFTADILNESSMEQKEFSSIIDRVKKQEQWKVGTGQMLQ